MSPAREPKKSTPSRRLPLNGAIFIIAAREPSNESTGGRTQGPSGFRAIRFSLQKDDWVEFMNDDNVLGQRAERLLQVIHIDVEGGKVIVQGKPVADVDVDPSKHPLLRR